MITTNLYTCGFAISPHKLVVFKDHNEPLSTLSWGPTFLKIEFELTNSQIKNNPKMGRYIKISINASNQMKVKNDLRCPHLEEVFEDELWFDGDSLLWFVWPRHFNLPLSWSFCEGGNSLDFWEWRSLFPLLFFLKLEEIWSCFEWML